MSSEEIRADGLSDARFAFILLIASGFAFAFLTSYQYSIGLVSLGMAQSMFLLTTCVFFGAPVLLYLKYWAGGREK